MAEGYRDFTAGETLTAANLEDFCELQGIMRFDDASSRNTDLSAVLTEGLLAYLKDTNTITVYTGSAWSTVGPVHGALTSWTPAVVQSGSVTVTVTQASYMRIGRRIIGDCQLSVTGSGTGSNAITISLPVAAAGGNTTVIGTGRIIDVSAPNRYSGVVVVNSGATTCSIVSTGAAGPTEDRLGANSFTAGLASGDLIAIEFSYTASADA